MQFCIIGAGAIGCLFGARLAIAGHDVILVHRRSTVIRTIRKNGVYLRELDGTRTQVRLRVKKGPVSLRKTEVVIVAVKAFDTSAVAHTYQKKISPETTVVSLQNGLGNVESLQSLRSNYLLAASTSEGALSLGDGKVVHTGEGVTQLGDLRGRTNSVEASQNVKDALVEARFRASVSWNMTGVLWTKAIINGAINPLTSLTRMSNGALLKSKPILEIAKVAIDEGVSVSRVARIKLTSDPTRLLHSILRSTAGNKSSMLQDVEKGRETEIDQINGSIIRYGRRLGVKTPVNEVLTNLVLGLTSR